MKPQIPLIALTLLLLSYTIQGYLLHHVQQPLVLSAIVSTYVFIQVVALSPIAQKVGRSIRAWIGSDVIHLVAILTIAFFVGAAMVWAQILENMVLIVAVELLARLELQHSLLNRRQKWAVLSGCLIGGLALGWFTYELMSYGPIHSAMNPWNI